MKKKINDLPDNIIIAKDTIGISRTVEPNVFKYDLTEFCTSIKPSCFKYVRSLVLILYFFDPDILVLFIRYDI
jgi:hypothetical protein